MNLQVENLNLKKGDNISEEKMKIIDNNTQIFKNAIEEIDAKISDKQDSQLPLLNSIDELDNTMDKDEIILVLNLLIDDLKQKGYMA